MPCILGEEIGTDCESAASRWISHKKNVVKNICGSPAMVNSKFIMFPRRRWSDTKILLRFVEMIVRFIISPTSVIDVGRIQ